MPAGGPEPELAASDLAPGDGWAASYDWSNTAVHRVRSAADARFAAAHARLWTEFGARGEMERREVIASRLAWDPARPVAGNSLLYELLVVERQGRAVAVRDHTAILPRGGDARGGARPRTVVHLSHVWVSPEHRGTGLAAWLRALPLETARCCARAAGGESPAPVTLVAEMDHPDAAAPERRRRLRTYERAGFLKLDPAAVPYAQPDFRLAAEIDASSLRPVPLALVVRRVDAEAELEVSGAEVRRTVAALYAVLGAHVRPKDMEPLWQRFAALPDGDQPVRLVPPTR